MKMYNLLIFLVFSTVSFSKSYGECIDYGLIDADISYIGSSTLIRCPLVGIDRVFYKKTVVDDTFFWAIETREYNNESMTIHYTNITESNIVINNQYLLFLPVKMYDNRTYVCYRYFNDTCKQTASVDMITIDQDFTETGNVNTDVILRCPIINDYTYTYIIKWYKDNDIKSKSNIKWYKDNIELHSDQHYNIKEDTLVVLNTTYQDSGVYKCDIQFPYKDTMYNEYRDINLTIV
ncbi:IL-1 recelptor type 2 [Murmansk poxvirus]|uniref:IL-1 recelptor type 2 n=1 Tax=Murmansk poxvirus TaxID=2025359 RepID=A0A223FN10_9POXV|nr:IL-1 recelptor type 2 [Murmansk poxvirus]AST09374.1 IL-1 recelptor type 2 [Murmansk poxvirus]